jgi:hypothetical protein
MPWVGTSPTGEVTFDAVVDELRVRAPELTQARAVRFVTWRLGEMVGDADYRRKVTVLAITVADQAAYDIPAGVVDIRRVWVGDGRYALVSYDDVHDLVEGDSTLNAYYDGVFAATDSADGAPQVIVWPTPTESGVEIVAEESYQGSEVSYGAGAVTILPTHLVPRLLDGALAEAYEASARHDLAQYHDQRYRDGKVELRRYKNSRVGSGPTRIRLMR